MEQYIPVTDIIAREILDSRGNPTVEVEVLAGSHFTGRAMVPSGASTGKYEAIELRDGKHRYQGLGVRRAVEHVNDRIIREILGMNVLEQAKLDRMLLELDGTDNKINLGANAMLGVSLAAARAAADALEIPLYQYLGGVNAKQMPVPMMNILNGGRHADNSIDLQEFMIMPVGAETFHDGLRMGTEVYHFLRQILDKEGYSTSVGDEGGFAPDLSNADEVFRYLMRAVEKAGYEPGKDIMFAMDAAASELYDAEKDCYDFTGEDVCRSSDELIDYYEALCKKYPIVSIEDGLDEEDWEGWKRLTGRLGKKVQLVGDDLFVTNVKRLKCGIDMGVANSILIKVNQIGTLTEAFHAIDMAKSAGYTTVISHRSGETEDSIIADIAVAVNAGQIKTGAPCRAERTAKYNELLRIEEELDGLGRYEAI